MSEENGGRPAGVPGVNMSGVPGVSMGGSTGGRRAGSSRRSRGGTTSPRSPAPYSTPGVVSASKRTRSPRDERRRRDREHGSGGGRGHASSDDDDNDQTGGDGGAAASGSPTGGPGALSSLAFTALSAADMERLGAAGAEGDGAMRDMVASIFGLGDHLTNVRSSVLVDYYTGVIAYVRDAALDAAAASVVFAVFKNTHATAMENDLTREAAFDLFKTALLEQVAQSPALFTDVALKGVAQFSIDHYFRHYLLYHYVFRREREVDAADVVYFLETAAAVPPLADFVSEEALEAQRAKEAAQQARREASAAEAEAMEAKLTAALEAKLPELAADGSVGRLDPREVQAMLLDSVAGDLEAYREQAGVALRESEAVLVARIARLEASLKH